MKDKFTLEDSGKREESESGMVRDARGGKGRFDLMSPIALLRIARVYEKGAEKYEDRNWEKGREFSRFIDSALRHINQYLAGETTEDHLAQGAWNLMAVMHLETTHPEMDDIPKSNLLDTETENDGGFRGGAGVFTFDTLFGNIFSVTEGESGTLGEWKEHKKREGLTSG